MLSDGVTSNSNEVLLEGVPIIEKGKKMEGIGQLNEILFLGQFFPIVYEV